MVKNQFSAILPLIVAAEAERIAKAGHLDENAAIEKLYATQLYSFLEDEETKVWQFSADKLFDLYQTEMTTGKLDFPDY